MSEEPFSREAVKRMIDHMNDDHADSVLLYARHFAGKTAATSAVLNDVTPKQMTLTLDNGETIDIPFLHRLEDGHDAHITMVKMSKEARQALEG